MTHAHTNLASKRKIPLPTAKRTTGGRRKAKRKTQAAAGGNVIRIRGARVNNLQGIDVDIPRDALTVITGVSGNTSIACRPMLGNSWIRFPVLT